MLENIRFYEKIKFLRNFIFRILNVHYFSPPSGIKIGQVETEI